MKKSAKTKAIAAMFATGIMFTGCQPPDVQIEYGPPMGVVQDDPQEDYGAPIDYQVKPPETSHHEDEIQIAYGPPIDYEEEQINQIEGEIQC